MGLPHYVSRGERRLFYALRNTLLYRVGRVDLFSRHPGVSVAYMMGTLTEANHHIGDIVVCDW